jgi:hypothetical protein
MTKLVNTWDDMIAAMDAGTLRYSRAHDGYPDCPDCTFAIRAIVVHCKLLTQRIRELEMENAELVTQRAALIDNFKGYAEEHS